MENRAIINLKLLKENAKKIKVKLPKNTLFCAVVKANAYGHGIVECANALYGIADYYAVATLEEGVCLRLSGIDKPILLLAPVYPFDIIDAVKNDLTLSIDNLTTLIKISKTAKILQKFASVHIKFNSGMNRLGTNSLDEITKIMEYSRRSKRVKVKGLYSHLNCPENARITKLAVERFNKAKKLVKSFDQSVITHISASGGFLVDEYHDMVRIGLLLYGYKPFKSDKISVKPIMKIFSPVIKIRRVQKGEFCGYGNFRLKEGKNIAVIRYGYADGLDRIKTSLTLNNRCMDLSVVTDFDKNKGEYLVLDNADILAKKYKTISYEILCSSTIRAKREYIY